MTLTSLISNLTDRCAKSVYKKSVLAIVDTTAISCFGHANRLQSKNGLGPLSERFTLGYCLQPILCLDAADKMPLGISSVHIWNRSNDLLIDHHKRYISERESNKWYTPVKEARDTVLNQADHITFIMDREGDIYEVMEGLPDRHTDIVIRAHHDRYIIHRNSRIKTSQYVDGLPICGQLTIPLPSRKRSRERIVANIRFGTVIIPKAKHALYLSHTRDEVAMSIIEVKEVSNKKDKVHWRLWTSKPITTLKDAKEIIDIYKSRWHVEEMFRLMKTEAFDIESSELEKPENLFKLGVLVMEASLLIKQLKAVREEESKIRVDSIFTTDEIECLVALDADLKGTTIKQSNPFNNESLSWASRIIARIGGWKGYASQRPPGSITYKRGLERFYDVYEGFQIAKLMYKR